MGALSQRARVQPGHRARLPVTTHVAEWRWMHPRWDTCTAPSTPESIVRFLSHQLVHSAGLDPEKLEQANAVLLAGKVLTIASSGRSYRIVPV